MELTRDRIEQAFAMIGTLAAAEGRLIDIAVYGGSCLVLASNMREVTRDVDAVFLSERSRGYAIADSVGRQLGLPDAWLNQAVKTYAPPRGNPEPNLFPYGDYPKQGPVGLRVFTPAPEYLLAMKLLASRRDDPEGLARDRRDIHRLIGLTGLATKEQLADLVRTCYPLVPGIQARMEAKIEDIVRGCDHGDGSEPPAWNAGRGRPTR